MSLLVNQSNCLKYELLGDLAAERVARKIAQKTHLISLLIVPKSGSKGLTCQGLESIARAVSDHRKLTILNLEKNDCLGVDMEGRSAKALEKMLRKTRTLEYLNISDCGLTDRDVPVLIHGLISNNSLKKLAIHTNPISDRALEDICAITRLKGIQIEPHRLNPSC